MPVPQSPFVNSCCIRCSEGLKRQLKSMQELATISLSSYKEELTLNEMGTSLSFDSEPVVKDKNGNISESLLIQGEWLEQTPPKRSNCHCCI